MALTELGRVADAAALFDLVVELYGDDPLLARSVLTAQIHRAALPGDTQ